MKFLKPLTGIVVFAASTVFTSPVEGIEKRTPGGVYICTDINWGGTCGYAVQPLDECIRLGPDWDGKISSFGPDPCTACVGYAFVTPIFHCLSLVDVFSAAKTIVTRETGYSLILATQQADSGLTTHGMTNLEHLNAHRPAKCLLVSNDGDG
ncbi:hypothetical protein ACEPAH_2203 [Sanghuangporus vaninii]